ncbi:hypothetical protein [Maribacter sp. 2308TA10-17]|uniref:hypothetical protein n=1 Tax=Maribacter sp. 2308TA10-17 TaxID=3386276 RepID=UPI0039BD7ABA
MKFKYHFSFLLLVVLLTACTSNPTVDPIPEIVEDPTAATLIFPEDNTECNEGTILSETQSRVVFRWNASENTDSYEVALTNTEAAETSNFDATKNSKEITLERGTAYEWYVISKSEESQITATSETFQFFNAAPGIVNHVPFSAEAIAPADGAEVTAAAGKITLQWEVSDIDNDIKDYEVFFGIDKNLLEGKGVFIDSSLDVDVLSGNTYFWMVKTNDETNNTSISEVFSFSVL